MQKNSAQKIEISGSERAFRLDRDTFLVYTGLHPDDHRPFIRVGAGNSILHGYLGQIEHVLLLDKAPLNVGQEMRWLKASLKEVQEPVRYVGSRERVSQIYNITGMPELDEEERPIEIEAFAPARQNADQPKDRCQIQFFANGNAQAFVGRSKVFDYDAIARSKGTIDDEFRLMERAQSRLKKKAANPNTKSFVYPGSKFNPSPLRPFLFWNFSGKGVLLNPPLEYHEALFESNISVVQTDFAISHAALSPGISALLRRKNHEGTPTGLYTGNEEKQAILKKIYGSSKLRVLNDGSFLPGQKDVLFFLSRKGNNGAFGFRFSKDGDEATQIVYPIGGASPSRSFDLLRPPHDLEIITYEDKEEFKEGHAFAHLTLALPGTISEKRFRKKRLADGLYPLLAKREYFMHTALEKKAFVEAFIDAFSGTTLHEFVREYLLMNAGLDFQAQTLVGMQKALLGLEKITDPDKLNNLSELLRYTESLPAFQKAYTEENQKLHAKLRKKFRLRQMRFADWLSLEGRPLACHIYFLSGKESFLLVKPADAPEPICLECPPPIEQLEADPKTFRKALVKKGRALDKADEAPGYAECLDLIETLYEKRLEIIEDRKRLKHLFSKLGLKKANEPEKQEASQSFIQRLWSKIQDFFFEKIPALSGRSGISRLVVPLLLLATFTLVVYLLSLISFPSLSSSSSTFLTKDGSSQAEIQATELVAPGSTQTESHVPGEEDIPAQDAEVYLYANILAKKNGFRRIGRRDGKNLKNPNLVFPGDTLLLPDGRKAKVKPGQYIWEIAKTHYKRDSARLQILARRIQALKEKSRSNPKAQKQLNRLQKAQARLAVTPAMKKLASPIHL